MHDKRTKIHAVLLAVFILFAFPGVSYAAAQANEEKLAASTPAGKTVSAKAPPAEQAAQTASSLKLQFQSTLANVKKLTAAKITSQARC